MTNYTKTTDFAAKDALPSGNSAKIVKGSEIDTEFNNIATASATKANANDAVLTGTTTAQTLDISGNVDVDGTLETDALSLNGVTVTSTAAELNYVDGVTSNIQTQLNTKAPLASPTFTGTVTVPGLTTTANVLFGDNDKAIFGASSDLQIYHDSSDSIINDNGTGSLKLQQGGSTKLEVTTTGIDVTGTVTSDGLTVDTTTLVVDASNNSVGIGISSPSQKLHVRSTTSNPTGIGLQNSERYYAVRSNNYSLVFSDETVGQERMRIDSSGNLLVGATSFATNLSSYAQIEASGSNGGIVINSSSTGASDYSRLVFTKSNSDGNEGLIRYNTNDYHMAFWTDAEERMRIDSSGNVTIGSSDLSANAALKFQADTGTFTLEHDRDSHGLTLSDSDGTGEILRIDTLGNLLVGKTTSSIATAGTAIRGDNPGLINSVRNGVILELNRLSTDGAIVDFFKDGTTVGSIGTYAGDLTIGDDDIGIRFDTGAGLVPWDLGATATGGSARDNAIDIGVASARFKDLYLSGTVYGGGRFSAGATGDGTFHAEGVQHIFRKGSAGSYAELGRFDTSGNLLVGVTSIADATSRAFGNAFSGSGSYPNWKSWGSGAHTHAQFRNGTSVVGSITTTASATTYNTSSDQRLKDNIIDAPSASDDIDAIQVRSFDWKADGSHQKYGMVAQELQAVAPDAVTGDAGPDEMMGVDYSKLVPMLVKEIQSLRARVAQLEN